MGRAAVPAGSDCTGVVAKGARVGLVLHSNQAVAAFPPGVTLPFKVALVLVTAGAAPVADEGVVQLDSRMLKSKMSTIPSRLISAGGLSVRPQSARTWSRSVWS